MPIPYLYPSTFPYGSRSVTFIFRGVTAATASVILESVEVSENTTEINRQTALGAPNGFVLINEPRTGTATGANAAPFGMCSRIASSGESNGSFGNKPLHSQSMRRFNALI
jgi:hypothetical protein